MICPLRFLGLLAAAGLTVAVPLADHAAMADGWNAITGSPATDKPPGSSASPSPSGIPTWGRGGGWHSNPQPTPPAPAPRRTPAQCALSVDPPDPRPGGYATATVVLTEDALRRLGRLEVLVQGEPMAGVTRQGNAFRYGFSLPEPAPKQFKVGFVAIAAQTDPYGNTHVLCRGETALGFFRVAITGDAFAAKSASRQFQATVEGGTPPFRFVWQAGGRSVTPAVTNPRGRLSHFAHRFERTGQNTLSVAVTDGEGRTTQSALRVEVYSCGLTVAGPGSLTEGEMGTWTATLASDHPPYRFLFSIPGVGLSNRFNLRDRTQSHSEVMAAGRYDLQVVAGDKYGCEYTVSKQVFVDKKPTATPTTRAATPGLKGCQDPKGCACPGGGRTWQRGQTCCGNVICQPGMRCAGAGRCLPRTTKK